MKFFLKQHVGSSLYSDWSVNIYAMVVYENYFSVMVWTENSD